MSDNPQLVAEVTPNCVKDTLFYSSVTENFKLMLSNKPLCVNRSFSTRALTDNSSFCKGAPLINTDLLPCKTSWFYSGAKCTRRSRPSLHFLLSCFLRFLFLFLGVLKVEFLLCLCLCAAPGDRLNEKRWMLLRATGKDNE